MKKVNIYLLFIISSINVFSENIKPLSQAITTYRWSLPIESSAIRFNDNGTYDLGHPRWDGYFSSGKYRIKEDFVYIDYPYEVNPADYDYYKIVLDWFFEGKSQVIYKYDKDYVDFNVLTCLKNGNKVLKNYAFDSPIENVYSLGDVKVIKKKEVYITVYENMKMRKQPNIYSETNTFDYSGYFSEYGTPPSMIIVQGIKIDLLLKGFITTYDAVTVQEDFIDNKKAPWYRISMNESMEGESRNVWIFGGYIKELNVDRTNELNEIEYMNLVSEAIRKGILKSKSGI